MYGHRSFLVLGGDSGADILSLINDTVYFNKMNTQNQYHLMRGQIIVTDLLENIAYIPEGKNAQNYLYVRPNGVSFEDTKNEKAAATTKQGSILAINTHSENGLEGNIYKLMSIFRHEILHIREQPLYKPYWQDYTFEAHANVYEEQMTYSEFLKTPENYQLHILRHYILRVFNGYYKGPYHQPIKFANTLEEFNKSTGKKIGATLEIQKIPKHLIKNRVDVKVIIYMNGVQRTTIEYEEIAKPSN